MGAYLIQVLSLLPSVKPFMLSHKILAKYEKCNLTTSVQIVLFKIKLIVVFFLTVININGNK